MDRNLTKILFVLFLVIAQSADAQRFYGKLKDYCELLPSEFGKIAGDRQESLEEIGNYILEKYPEVEEIELLFVCDRNSRRSQFARIWAQTAAYYYKIKHVRTFSGGLSPTAVNYHTMEALKRAGFSLTAAEAYSDNPVYLLSAGRRYPDILIFSKRYDHWSNPKMDFGAVFCSDGPEFSNLHIPGAEVDIDLPYEDLGIFDSSSYGSAEKNDEICREIAKEMFYLMDYVSSQKRKRK